MRHDSQNQYAKRDGLSDRFLRSVLLGTHTLRSRFLPFNKPLSMLVLSICCFGGELNLISAQPPAPQDGLLAPSIHGRLSRKELEEMLYGVLGGSRQAFRQKRRGEIERYIDRVHLVCDLGNEQRTKLEQAIDFDLVRTEAEVASLLSAIDDKTSPVAKQRIYHDAYRQVRKIAESPPDVESNLWAKVLHSSLTPTQTRLLEADEAKIEARKIHRSRLQLVLICQREFGLTREDREQLRSFLERPEHAMVITRQDLQQTIKRLAEGEDEDLHNLPKVIIDRQVR